LWLFSLACETIKFYFNFQLSSDNFMLPYFWYLYLLQYSFGVKLGLAAVLYYPSTELAVDIRTLGEDVTDRTGLISHDMKVHKKNYGSAKVQDEDEKPKAMGDTICPELTANIVSRLLFLWLNPLIKLGYERPLTNRDVWQLPAEEESASLSDRFEAAWQDEKLSSAPSLVKALRKEFLYAWFVSGLFKILNDGSQFVGPFFIGKMIKFIQDPENPPAYIGYEYAVGLFVGALIGAIGECQYFQGVMKVGLQVRQAMICSIFRHSMQLTNSSRKEKSGGEMSNLITSDCEILQMAVQYLHTLWSAPLRIILAVYMLYAQLGPPSLVGVAVLVVAIPLQVHTPTHPPTPCLMLLP
jgi:hypothetical protein